MPEMVTITLSEYRDLIAKAAKLEMLTMDIVANMECMDRGISAVDRELVLHVTGLSHYKANDMEDEDYE